MAIFNKINLSQLEFVNRFDGELYNPKLRISLDILHKSGFQIKKLKEFCLIKSGTTPIDRDDTNKIGPILFKTTDIRNAVLNPHTEYYHISESIHNRMSSTKILEDDVLLNIVGATLDVIGRSAFTANYFDQANITQAMVFLRIQSGLKSGYLFSYLNTKFAQDQIKRYARPTGQFNLNLTEVGQIEIPRLDLNFQEKIHLLIKKSGDLLQRSSKLYLQATKLLEQELGLDKLPDSTGFISKVPLSQVVIEKRFDSEHFPLSFTIMKKQLLKKGFCSNLLFIRSFNSRGRQPEYSVKGIAVLNSKHIRRNEVIFDTCRKALIPKDKNQIIQYGDVLLNGTGVGTIGRAAPYLEEFPSIPDNHVTILRTNLDSGYLSVYLNSLIGQLQVSIYQRGSSGQIELYPSDIDKFLIWEAPKDLQKEIGDKIRNAYLLKKESKLLLEQAKSEVETLIEQAANRG